SRDGRQETVARSRAIQMKLRLFAGGAALGFAVLVFVASLRATEQGQVASQSIQIDADDIAGVVSGSTGPEAGAWVIAETLDLPPKFAKIAVTDEAGRYLLPDLPKANYQVWVRGYGLIDSPKVQATPGKMLNLRSSGAPNAAAATQYYPPIYWFSMLHVP